MTSPPSEGGGTSLLLYVGTRSREPNHIHCLSLDVETGQLSEAAPACPAENPSFIAIHPDRNTLYAVNELGQTRADDRGTVSSFAMDPATGRLAFLNRQPTGGAAPCHLTVAGGRLFVANYWGGSFAAFPIAADGSVGPAIALVQHDGGAVGPDRDPGPHVHWVSPDPTGRHLVVTDLGRDEVLVYRLNQGGEIPLAGTPLARCLLTGAGPRHAVFLDGGRRLAVAAELASTITLLDCHADTGDLGTGTTLSTLPDGWTGDNAVAEIAASSDQRFLYVSNRGHDSIAIFRRDADGSGMRSFGFSATGGARPRHFAIDPTGRALVVANQGSDALTVFRIDSATGGLQPIGAAYSIPAPACVAFLPPARR
jgi:6-phosphogluconolactonase